MPSLVGIKPDARLRLQSGRQLGQRRDAGAPFADAAGINALYAFLGEGEVAGEVPPRRGADLPVGGLGGPVVASGGAPGGLEPPPINENSVRQQFGGNNRFVGPPYPEGVEAPTARHYSGYG